MLTLTLFLEAMTTAKKELEEVHGLALAAKDEDQKMKLNMMKVYRIIYTSDRSVYLRIDPYNTELNLLQEKVAAMIEKVRHIYGPYTGPY